MPLELCNFEKRLIDRNSKGKPMNRNQIPKKFGLNFLLHEVVAKLYIAPLDKPDYGVVLVGEQVGYFGRMKLRCVSWEPKVRDDLQYIVNASHVDRVFSGTSAKDQDYAVMQELLKQLFIIRPLIGDAAQKAGVKLSEYIALMSLVAQRDSKTPVGITYLFTGKWKNWCNKMISYVNRDIRGKTGVYRKYLEARASAHAVDAVSALTEEEVAVNGSEDKSDNSQRS